MLSLAVSSSLWLITAYCPSYECGALGHGVTASGVRAVEGVTAACPPELPFGTKLAIEGMGVRVCEDRGSAIQGRHLDIFIGSVNEQPDRGRKRALSWNRGRSLKRRVKILWMPGQPVKEPPALGCRH